MQNLEMQSCAGEVMLQFLNQVDNPQRSFWPRLMNSNPRDFDFGLLRPDDYFGRDFIGSHSTRKYLS